MSENQTPGLQEFRRERLKAAAKKAGGNAPLGRLLGYVDGAFVGQMLRNERPITEKTVAALESKPGYRDWFGTAPLTAAKEPAPDYSEHLPLAPDERDLVLALRNLPKDEQLETIRDVMHRAETFQKAVTQFLADKGIAVSSYVTASRAAETLPAPPSQIDEKAAGGGHSRSGRADSPLTHNTPEKQRKERKA